MFISINVPLRFNKTDVKCLSKETLNSFYFGLSLMSISSYVVHSTKETGNIHAIALKRVKL